MEPKKLVLQIIEEENIIDVVKLLKKKKILLSTKRCKLCAKELTKEEIGGFLPFEGKIAPICADTKCILKASFLTMEHNGNGSPIIEI